MTGSFRNVLRGWSTPRRRCDTVGLVTSYRLSDDGVDCVALPYWQVMATGSEITRQILLQGPMILGGPTAMLFRSELVRERDPFFDGRYWTADNEAALWTLSRSDLGYVHQVLTFQRRQPGRVFDWAMNMNDVRPRIHLLSSSLWSRDSRTRRVSPETAPETAPVHVVACPPVPATFSTSNPGILCVAQERDADDPR